MAAARRAFVHEGELVAEAGADPSAPGGAVTVSRTLFVDEPADEHEIRTLATRLERGVRR